MNIKNTEYSKLEKEELRNYVLQVPTFFYFVLDDCMVHYTIFSVMKTG
jgi:hypothetical protein